MSEFWARKVRTFFHTVDVNDDGLISKKDAEGLADNLADVEHLSPERRALIKDNFVKVNCLVLIAPYLHIILR